MNGQPYGTRLIDTSVSDATIAEAKRKYVKYLSERLLIAGFTNLCALPDEPTDNGLTRLNEHAWKAAEMHYDEMIRREALADPVSLAERMAADNIVRAAA